MMPDNKPTAKKRPPVDAWYFELVKQAYGNRCCSCGKPESELKEPLQRGHITLHAKGGSVEPENLIPVCLQCNRKYTLTDTPFVYFPVDWRERLAGLLLQRLDPKYHVDVVSNHGNVVLKSKPDENTRLVNLKDSDFGLPTGVYPWSPTRALPPHEKQATIKELVAMSRKCDPPPNYPTDRRQKEMRELLDNENLGRETFLRVGAHYLKKELWITPDKRFVQDSWAQFTEGFEFLQRGMEQEARARKVAKDKERAAELRQRWETYKRAGECGDWPGMKDEERTLRDKAKCETELRVVADAEFTLAAGMPGMEFRAKKLRCQDFIHLCDQMIAASDELRGNYSTEFLFDRLKEIKTVDGLHNLHEGIQKLYRELHQYSGYRAYGPDDF